jgi:hypothetical protein
MVRVTQPAPSFTAQYHLQKTHHLLQLLPACTLSGIEPIISSTLDTACDPLREGRAHL